MVKLLVNIMVYKLVLIKACFEPLRYYFFLKYRPIVNKKTSKNLLKHAIKKLSFALLLQFVTHERDCWACWDFSCAVFG